MLGQTRLEFIFGVIVFAIIIFYIVSQINITFSTMINDYDINNLKARASNMIKFLVEAGDGVITDKPYDVSVDKVQDLNQNCDNLEAFDMKEYRLKIYNSTDLLLFCGTDTLKPSRVSVTKYVLIGNDIGNITLELW